MPIRKPVETGYPFLKHGLSSLQAQNNISSRKYRVEMMNLSGDEQIFERISGARKTKEAFRLMRFSSARACTCSPSRAKRTVLRAEKRVHSPTPSEGGAFLFLCMLQHVH
jgi:hypothetical protein